MGKKKFIDKKKSATFHLFARDSSDPNYTETSDGANDRVFVRVDNNPFSLNDEEEEDHEEDPNSIFADAPEEEDVGGGFGREFCSGAAKPPLPDHVRREILVLGFPDDGYNYLTHMREIRNAGGGSAYYENPRTRLDLVPRDVKAYDATKVQIKPADEGDSGDSRIYDVASKSVNVRPQKAIDPDVSALLDDSDLSQFASDDEDLEEDFVVRANLPGEGEILEEDSEVTNRVINEFVAFDNQLVKAKDYSVDEKSRDRNLLDEQFDILVQQEYATDDDDGYNDDDSYNGDDGYNGCLAVEEEESIREKFKILGNEKDDLELGDKYELPPDDILHRTSEYGKKYENESEDEQVIIAEESSDESEQWDCDTIVSTYSNLDNHPGRIGAPDMSRKKKLADTVSRALTSTSQVISLGGKEKLPLDFLPRSKTAIKEKVQTTSEVKAQPQRTRQHGQETKEEKKERKAAIKEERREARKMKKEMKGLYHHEAQRAQRAAALSAPSSIRIM
ncbi:uncharacterized protein [Rutidosis leptorrhynchoides]|uniref:uncharacterized protein n=1 Tax=Rutidosis leptorrhynchoides TaxID=125765 RepID=UPI003A999B35